ncbi:hypothetical protein BV25DRAFT_1329 [Artomyces pyxidatus]|uniref:Uncharacterized protein n=1 Tax=Artomyces pyxidatus TaxID=48021 RepID=A0ACB8TJC8_9AGAM|nr:hypothetical protein BV25DRAFT_1329 [Artomyces pyxidatus]
MTKSSTSQTATDIAGTAPDQAKQRVANSLVNMAAFGFVCTFPEKLHVTEVSIGKNTEEPAKTEARVVCEVVVEEEMLNALRVMHGGCLAFFIDICGTLPSTALLGHSGVSLNISVSYHAPAKVGDKLKIISTTLSNGARVTSTRGEIWNVTTKRLVASGVHTMMEQSVPRL